MQVLLTVLVVLLLLVNAGVIILFFFRKGGGEGLSLIQQRIEELGRTMDERLDRSTKTLNESVQTQMRESYRLVKDVTEGLTKLEETNKNVLGFADQLQGLQDILKNPKQRGILGEYYLETVLKNVLPPGSYQMQYAFPNGEIVDAVVKVQERVIPIDSKFSLDNYNRILETRDPAEKERLEKLFKQDLKMRIDETAKYVRPEEGTTEFAFMFIPAEGIYYDLIVDKGGELKTKTSDLIEYAFSKKVIIVSPTSFLAYLQTVLQGLKGLQIEKQAQEIRQNVIVLGKHLGAYTVFMEKLGTTLQTAANHYNGAVGEFKKIDKDVVKIGGESPSLLLEKVEGPVENS